MLYINIPIDANKENLHFPWPHDYFYLSFYFNSGIGNIPFYITFRCTVWWFNNSIYHYSVLIMIGILLISFTCFTHPPTYPLLCHDYCSMRYCPKISINNEANSPDVSWSFKNKLATMSEYWNCTLLITLRLLQHLYRLITLLAHWSFNQLKNRCILHMNASKNDLSLLIHI